MFNFSKEVVLNSLDGAAKVEAPAAGSPQKTGTKLPAKVRFRDGGEYFSKYIVDGKIYKTQAIKGTKATIDFDVTKLKNIGGSHFQICIELGLDNQYRGDFGSALYYFRKPIVIDILTAGLTDKALAKAFKTVVPKEYPFVGVYTSEDEAIMPTKEDAGTEKVATPSADHVLLVAEDSYIKIRKIDVVGYTCESRCEGSSEMPVTVVKYTGVTTEVATEDFTDAVKVTKNSTEYGTANWLLHNLRLPTYANMRFTSPSAPEMPIPGAEYVQYSFAYCVPRSISFGGMSVAGQTNHSTTMHTFFVLSTLVTEFEKLWEGLDPDVKPFVEISRNGEHVVTILANAYASAQDLASAASDKATAEAVGASSVEELKTKLAEVKSTAEANKTKNTEQDTTLASKANASDVYTKTEADGKFQDKS